MIFLYIFIFFTWLRLETRSTSTTLTLAVAVISTESQSVLCYFSVTGTKTFSQDIFQIVRVLALDLLSPL